MESKVLLLGHIWNKTLNYNKILKKIVYFYKAFTIFSYPSNGAKIYIEYALCEEGVIPEMYTGY